jgi:hypothetical protein
MSELIQFPATTDALIVGQDPLAGCQHSRPDILWKIGNILVWPDDTAYVPDFIEELLLGVEISARVRGPSSLMRNSASSYSSLNSSPK